MSDNSTTIMLWCGSVAPGEYPVCEACGGSAMCQDREGVWLCEDDYNHLLDHWLIEEAANGRAKAGPAWNRRA